MKIAGFMKTSLVDWPGQICSTVFTAGCNFRCPFCHNPELVQPDLVEQLEAVPIDHIICELHKRKGLIDGVCITGGEPLIYPEIEQFMKRVKDMGLKVKLDTNGSNPKLLSMLIDKKLIDYVAMDIKAPDNKYSIATGINIQMEPIRKSIAILMEEKVPYEFRTTVLPTILKPQDIEDISKSIKGARAYYLQQFNFDMKMLDENLESTSPYTPDELKEMLKKIKPNVRLSGIRGI